MTNSPSDDASETAKVLAYWEKELPRVRSFPAPLFATKIEETIDILRRADQPVRVVKPLVWEDHGSRNIIARAETPFWLEYLIWSDLMLHGCEKGACGPYDSADAAKAAAQADYERRILAALLPTEVGAKPFQSRVQPWLHACFGVEISGDRLERSDRLLEEVFELLQSSDYPRERIASLSSYVWSRPKGEPAQEVGGVMVTLAGYCLAHGIDMHDAGETELARVWTKVEKIRAKQAAKPTGSALPQAWPDAAPPAAPTDNTALVDVLMADNDRLRKLYAEYGRVESAIIMADPEFDGDSDHANCGDRLIASVQHMASDLSAALAREGAVAMEVLTRWQVDDACMSFRHDFGLLSIAEANQLRFECREWHRAIGKAVYSPTAAAALARREDEVWNEAIEAAATYLDGFAPFNRIEGMPSEIRALKRSGKE